MNFVVYQITNHWNFLLLFLLQVTVFLVKSFISRIYPTSMSDVINVELEMLWDSAYLMKLDSMLNVSEDFLENFDRNQNFSLPILISISDSPICVSGQKIIYAMVPNQILQISCEMEAYPIGMTFSWTNRNGGSFPSDWLYNISQKGSISYIEILKASNLPTEVACSAQNSVGSSREPCIKTILQAGEFICIHFH